MHPPPADGSITAGASILTGRVEYNLAELEEMERLMEMLKQLGREKKFMSSAHFWWDNFKRYLKNQGCNLTVLKNLGYRVLNPPDR